MGYSYSSRFLVLILVFLLNSAVFAKTLEVCPKCHIRSVAEAVLAADSQDTIKVYMGEYRENSIVINKPLKLISESIQKKPVINGENKGNIFFVTSSDVEISGFELRNSGFSDIDDQAGIKVMNAKRCRINNNHLIDNSFGIFLGNTNDCVIDGNFVSSKYVRKHALGDGIHVWYGDRIILMNNHLERNRDGIYLEFVTNSRILKNTSNDNRRYGLHFMFSHNNEYVENLFNHNVSGVAVMYSRNISMFRNQFKNSLGSASYGILLKDISSSQIKDNLFAFNTTGAYLEGTTRSNFDSNIFQSNGWALKVLGSSDSVVFMHNDFIDNTFDVSTNTSRNLNSFSENYWDAHSTLDLDGDGIGDQPYFPVRLSVLLMERYGVSILLIKSFFMSIIDQAERLFPILTPESLRDDKPKIKRVAIKL